MLGQSALSLALSVLVAAPALINAHGQLAWVKVQDKTYPAWNLDDHYKAAYKKQDPQYGQQPEQKFTRKTDRLDLGPTNIFGKSIATGGYQDSLDFDDISPVGVISASAGDEVTVQWDDHWPQGHPGPIGEWMAKCPGDSCTKVDATTLDWFCIAQHNYDADVKDWPTEIMTRNGRQHKFYLPNDLPGGAYIVRHAVYALHNNTGPVDGTSASPQTYPVAFEITLQSSGTSLPTATGRLPGMFSYDDYEWHHDIYHDGYNGDLPKWEFPGIAVYPGGYTTGVVNGKTLAARVAVGKPPAAGNAAPAPAASSPASSAAAAASSSSSVAAVEASSTSAASPSASDIGNNHAVVEPTGATGPAATPASTAPSSSYAVPSSTSSASKASKTCRVRTSKNKKRSAEALQGHQRKARSAFGRRH